MAPFVRTPGARHGVSCGYRVSDMAGLEHFYGPNAGYVVELFERYSEDPTSVDLDTRKQFDHWGPPDQSTAADTMPRSSSLPQAVVRTPTVVPSAAVPAGPVVCGADVAGAGVAALAQAIRFFGHLGAQLDPLGSSPPGDPQLELATHGVHVEDLAALPASVVGGPIGSEAGNAAEAIERLRRIYCSTTGYDFAHVSNPEERSWLLDVVESEQLVPPREPVDERWLLDRMTEVSAFERFLHRAYPGQTRFSVEGLGMMIPMLDELLDRAAVAGTRTVILGMAHRGRLNVLAHVLGKPYEQILAEFEGRAVAERLAPQARTDEAFTGDVKYHAGGRRAYPADEQPGPGTGTVNVVMVPNPSHLELVNPVVEGMARAADEDRRAAGPPRQDEAATLAVLIHGDASFPGQGIVAETLTLSRLAGYHTGGTLHLIANNQLGFTVEPTDARSTLYAGDLAKGFEIPVVHVNADDPVACLSAVRLAMEYRCRFRKDVLIDLIGYRRWGHNEGDEPAFTQPMMYELIRQHPTVRELFAAELVRRGVVGPDEPDALLRAGLDEFQRIRESALARANGVGAGQTTDDRPRSTDDAPPTTEEGRRTIGDRGASGEAANGTGQASAAAGAEQGSWEGAAPLPPEAEVAPEQVGAATSDGVGVDDLRELNRGLVLFPEGFALNPKLDRALRRRREAFDTDEATIDWGHAEMLAFAAILRDGSPIRLTGQDTIRGTFSQRHLAFYDAKNGDRFTPLEVLPQATASFDVRDSPLSENATIGFEYGYSVQAPGALVIWEAQYGDFINGAQAMIDEYVVSGEAKWGLESGLVLLLPHAWEGQGPDHSGGRLERFLQLAAEDNVRVANCTTAGQYFLLLRRQARLLRDEPRPLVVMTPKSLLRHPLAAARPTDLSGTFQPVLDDSRAAERPERVRRVVFCSGKVWADVESEKSRAEDETLAVVRVEELYPFPIEEVQAILDRYARAGDVVWLQEEPRNAGAWTFVEPRLRELVDPSRELRYVGRPERASPAEGWSDVHRAEQRRLVEAVLEREARQAGQRTRQTESQSE